MKKILVPLCAAGMLFLAGCTTPTGTVSAPIMLDVKDSGAYYDANVKAARSGTSEVTGIICFASGDGSIEAAMRNGGITKLQRVDYEYSNILGIVSKKKTIVWGE